MGLDDLESHVYAAALAKTKGNVSAATRLLKISRAQLDYRIVKGGINRGFLVRTDQYPVWVISRHSAITQPVTFTPESGHKDRWHLCDAPV
jgi:Bacterial regulatory protein, Fis family